MWEWFIDHGGKISYRIRSPHVPRSPAPRLHLRLPLCLQDGDVLPEHSIHFFRGTSSMEQSMLFDSIPRSLPLIATLSAILFWKRAAVMAPGYLSAVQKPPNLIAFPTICCAGHDLNKASAPIFTCKQMISLSRIRWRSIRQSCRLRSSPMVLSRRSKFSTLTDLNTI